MAKRLIITWGKGGMPTDTFKHSDGGRLTSKRPNEDNDCAVRALALALRISYDDAFDFLELHGRIRNNGYHINHLLSDYLKPRNPRPLFGHKVTRIPFPSKKGYQRMYVAAFCALYPTGVYLLRMTRHVSTCIDGIIYDTWWSPTEIVYAAYRIEPYK